MLEPWTRKEVIGDCTLYLGDCLAVMPALGKVDAVVTDPPYGINVGAMSMGAGKKSSAFKAFDWDCSVPDVSTLTEYPAIIWGGNYFGLPASSRWLSWDKMQSFSGAEFELAWTNIGGPHRVFRMSRIEAYGNIDKQHPTQKPVALMQWCLGFLPNAETILDPFMGSGTTLVACAKLGRKGIGIELDPDYFEISCKRVQAAYDQPDLFVAPPTPPTQEGMDL
jgi:DNA modification methylase